MRAIKDNYVFSKALAAVFCCTLLISQSGLLFGQEADDKSTPPASSEKPVKPAKPTKPSKATKPTPPRPRGLRNRPSDNEEPKEKSKDEIPPLSEMLATALENNPDIGVAASQVTAAEAQLKRMQLNVMQQVMELREAWHTQLKLIKSSEMSRDNANQQWLAVRAAFEVGGVSTATEAETREKVQEVQTKLIQAQAKLAEIKAKVPYLLGTQKPIWRFGSGTMGSGSGTKLEFSLPRVMSFETYNSHNDPATPKAKPEDVRAPRTQANRAGFGAVAKSSTSESPTLAKLREALNDNTEIDFDAQPIEDVADYLRDLHNISITFDKKAFDSSFTGDNDAKKMGYVPIDCTLAGISLAAALQAIMDLHPQVTFVVRDYGLLVTVKGKEPVEAISVIEFVKRQPGATIFGGGGGGTGQF